MHRRMSAFVPQQTILMENKEKDYVYIYIKEEEKHGDTHLILKSREN